MNPPRVPQASPSGVGRLRPAARATRERALWACYFCGGPVEDREGEVSYRCSEEAVTWEKKEKGLLVRPSAKTPSPRPSSRRPGGRPEGVTDDSRLHRLADEEVKKMNDAYRCNPPPKGRR